MKKIVFTAVVLIFVCSCRKDAPGVQPAIFLRSVLAHLRDSLGPAGYSTLDTDRVFSGGRNILRIGYRGKPIAEEFLLVRTDSVGNVLRGQAVHLSLDGLSGSVETRSFSGKVVMSSGIDRGVITGLHGVSGVSRTIVEGKTVTMLPAPDADWLPEVVVVGYGGGSAGTPYMAFDGLVGPSSGGIVYGGGNAGGAGDAGASGASGGSGGGVVGPGTGGSGGDGSGGDGSGGNGSGGGSGVGSTTYVPVNPVAASIGRHGVIGGGEIELEGEYIYNIPTVDVGKLFKCFDLVPDEGASYTVQLCVDVPVNGNPAASSNVLGVNAGHSFLVVTKSGSGTTITQSFGFYPAEKLSVWNPFSTLQSAIKNNGGQEINGSLSLRLSAEQFANLRTAAISLSTKPYILDASNCTDYALGVFNSIRSLPIVLQPYTIYEPGVIVSGGAISPGFNVTIPNSPQRLFEKLSQMKAAGGPEALDIQLDLSHNLSAPDSHGECN